MTLEELRELREKTKQLQKQKRANTVQVIVGMGTCGIAAGAQETYDTFRKYVDDLAVANIEVTQTGCMGLCANEPTVEVRVPGMPDIIYGRVNSEIAKKIAKKHIEGGILINDHIYDKPSGDIITYKTEGVC